MRISGIAFLLIALFTSCEQTDPEPINNYQLTNGNYEGYFRHQGVSYWCLIAMENGQYIEWPSGGAMFQKSFSCLTTGFYSAQNNTLSFTLQDYKFKDFPETCPTDMLLPGKYEMTTTAKKDSLIFKRGTSENQITYHLKKHETGY